MRVRFEDCTRPGDHKVVFDTMVDSVPREGESVSIKGISYRVWHVLWAWDEKPPTDIHSNVGQVIVRLR